MRWVNNSRQPILLNDYQKGAFHVLLFSIIVPAYNEESNIPFFYNNLPQKIQSLPADYKINFINDAASDFKSNGTLTSFYDKGLKCQSNLFIGISNECEYDAL